LRESNEELDSQRVSNHKKPDNETVDKNYTSTSQESLTTGSGLIGIIQIKITEDENMLPVANTR
jgi:hypothetical protein